MAAFPIFGSCYEGWDIETDVNDHGSLSPLEGVLRLPQTCWRPLGLPLISVAIKLQSLSFAVSKGVRFLHDLQKALTAQLCMGERNIASHQTAFGNSNH